MLFLDNVTVSIFLWFFPKKMRLWCVVVETLTLHFQWAHRVLCRWRFHFIYSQANRQRASWAVQIFWISADLSTMYRLVFTNKIHNWAHLRCDVSPPPNLMVLILFFSYCIQSTDAYCLCGSLCGHECKVQKGHDEKFALVQTQQKSAEIFWATLMENLRTVL